MLQHNLQTGGVAGALEALQPMGETLKVLIGFLQVTSSFGITFANLGFPPEVCKAAVKPASRPVAQTSVAFFSPDAPGKLPCLTRRSRG